MQDFVTAFNLEFFDLQEEAVKEQKLKAHLASAFS